jgi:hypothetical protein
VIGWRRLRNVSRIRPFEILSLDSKTGVARIAPQCHSLMTQQKQCNQHKRVTPSASLSNYTPSLELWWVGCVCCNIGYVHKAISSKVFVTGVAGEAIHPNAY